ncbi:MAG: hypothetical protein IPP56_13380 [Bacteroidetes bacterium]|nr:hypothetical protein [Bacteroidota bacterium]MBK9672076.1 hypothetical protein [Bacteroidota bacterium]MBK9800650.1 hypothetical protein [Bacteroidota bacterium]MBP6414583.1 hypothetical protein [Bacteroidia bacterium]
MCTSYKRLLLIVFIIGSLVTAKAQDEILFLNGDYASVKVIDTSDYKRITVQKPGKTKLKTWYKEDIYSIKFNGGEETIIYKQDTLENEYFTPAEMRIYIQGEQDASAGYKTPVATAGACAVGLGSGLMLGFLAPIAPAVYTIIVGSRWIKIKKKYVSNPDLLKEEVYRMGYEKEARSKLIQNSIIGGGLSMVVGYVTANIILLKR